MTDLLQFVKVLSGVVGALGFTYLLVRVGAIGFYRSKYDYMKRVALELHTEKGLR